MSRPIVRATKHVLGFRPRAFRRSGWVMVGSMRLWEMSPEGYADFVRVQRQVPRLLSLGPDTVGRPPRQARLWAFEDFVWAADRDLDAEAVKGILIADRMLRARQIDGAKTLAATQGAARTTGRRSSREVVPDVVRSAVWARDGGQCVRCGATSQLQFDHIIPVARGGNSSVQNLQILCAMCNHYKYTNITNG